MKLITGASTSVCVMRSCRCNWADCTHLLGSMCQVATAALNLQVLHLGEGLMARAPTCPQLYSHLLDLLVLAGEHRHSCALQFLKVSPLQVLSLCAGLLDGVPKRHSSSMCYLNKVLRQVINNVISYVEGK